MERKPAATRRDSYAKNKAVVSGNVIIEVAKCEIDEKSTMHLPGFLVKWRSIDGTIHYTLNLQPPGGSSKNNRNNLAAFIMDEGSVIKIEFKWPDCAKSPDTFDLDFFSADSKRQMSIKTALKKHQVSGTNDIISIMYIKLPEKVHKSFFVNPSFASWGATGADVVHFEGRDDEYYVIELLTMKTDTAPSTPGVFSVPASGAAARFSGGKRGYP